jgi:hypothetical protein
MINSSERDDDIINLFIWMEEEEKFKREAKPLIDEFLPTYDVLPVSYRRLIRTLQKAQDILSIRRQDRNHRRFLFLMDSAARQITDITCDMIELRDENN